MNWNNILREILGNFRDANVTDGDNYYQFRFTQDFNVLTVKNHAWKVGTFNITTGEIVLDIEHIFTPIAFINEFVNTCTHNYVQNIIATYTLNIRSAISQVPTLVKPL
jgi:hypothetical protein